MSSKTDIINTAYQLCGMAEVTSPSLTQFVETRYEQVRKELLASCPWNFAIKRVNLSKTTSTPAFGYDNAFGLPSDFLRMVASENELDTEFLGNPHYNGHRIYSFRYVYPQRDNYKIVMLDGNKVLLSNEDAVAIEYVFDQQDVTKMSPMFQEAFGAYLAAKIAYRLTNNRTLAEVLYQQSQREISNAKTVDGQQGTTQPIRDSSYIAMRGFN